MTYSRGRYVRSEDMASSDVPSTTPPAPASATSEQPRRTIPGLSPALVPPATQPKQRKRAPKKQVSSPAATDVPNPDVPIPPEAKSHDDDAADRNREDDEIALLAQQQESKPGAAEVVQKRLRSTIKKVQRLEGYEASTVALNPDQQRALQGKPALLAVVRELSELSALLKADEAEDEARQQRLKAAYEKKQARAVEAAVKIAEVRIPPLLKPPWVLHGLLTVRRTVSTISSRKRPSRNSSSCSSSCTSTRSSTRSSKC